MNISDLTYQLDHPTKNTLVANITVPTNIMTNQADLVMKHLAGQVDLPGFRPGTVPVNLAAKQIGRDRLRQAIIEAVLPEAFRLIAEHENLRIALPPRAEIEEIGEGKPLKAKLLIDLIPEADVKGYQDIRVKHQAVSVTDDMVNDALHQLRRERAKTAVVERGAETGDLVDIAFTGKIDGVIKEQLTSTHYPLLLGEGQLIPGFEDQLIGLKRQAKKIFTLTLPKQGLPSELAGQTVDFEVEVHEVQAVTLPDIDITFAQAWNAVDEQDLRQKVKAQLVTEATKRAAEQETADLTKQLLAKTTVDLPPALIEEEVHRLKHELEDQAKQQGMEFEAYLLMLNQTPEKLSDTLKSQAVDRLRLGLALAAVATSEKIALNSDQDLAKVMERLKQIAHGEPINKPTDKE